MSFDQAVVQVWPWASLVEVPLLLASQCDFCVKLGKRPLYMLNFVKVHTLLNIVELNHLMIPARDPRQGCKEAEEEIPA